MAELSAPEATADPCCAPEQQADCCEPAAKSDCCGQAEGCGCDAGASPSGDARQRIAAPDGPQA